MAVISSGSITFIDLNDAIISGDQPTNPEAGQLWIKENPDPKPDELYVWTGTEWKLQPLSLEGLDPASYQDVQNSKITLGNMVDDSKIDIKDRGIVKDNLTQIVGKVMGDSETALPTVSTIDASAKGEVYSIRKQATNAGISTSNTTYTNVSTKYNDLKGYLDSMTPKPWDTSASSKDSVITVSTTTWRQKWLDYFVAVDQLAELISDTLEQKARDAEQNAKDYTDAEAVLKNGYPMTNTSGGTNKWSKFGTLTLKSQYATTVAEIIFQAGTSGGTAISSALKARVLMRVKQQNPLGQAPSLQMALLERNGVSTTDFAYVMTENSTTQTVVELYARMPLTYDNWVFTPVLQNGSGTRTFTWHSNQPLLASVPTGLATGTASSAILSASYADLQMTSPLPTDIKMDANGITAGSNQAVSYARLDYRGLYIHGGAIQIDGGLPDEEIASASAWNAKETPEGAQAKVDAVKIGGRNIVRGTAFTSTTGFRLWGPGTLSVVTDDAYVGFNYIKQETKDSNGNSLSVSSNTAIGIRNIDASFEVIGGKEYTVSMYVATGELGKLLDYVYLMHGDGGSNYSIPTIDISKFPVVTSAWSGASSSYDYHEVTFTFKADRSDKNAYLLIGGRTKRALSGSDGYAWIRISRLKVEEGNKKTDWTKAPEDVDKEIQDVGDGLRTDLRLTAPLPTALRLDGNGITASATGGGYARLDYRGLYINGGAIQIDGGLPDDQLASGDTWNKKTTLLDSTGLYTGTITFDQANGGILTLGGIDNANGIFRVLNSNGDTIAELDGNSGGFSSLYVADLQAPNVLSYGSDNLTFYVSDRQLDYSGSIPPDDSNDGTGWTKPLATIGEALRRIPKFYDGACTINVAYNSVLYENVYIDSYTGGGSITLSLGSARINGILAIRNNVCTTKITGGTVNCPAGSYAVVTLTKNYLCRLEGTKVYGNGTDNGFNTTQGYTELVNCEAYGINNGIATRYGATTWIENCKGYANSIGVFAYAGNAVGLGTCPGVPSGKKVTDYNRGGQILVTFNPDTGSATPPPPPDTTTTWNSTGGDSWRDNFGGQWYGQNEVVQGYWGGYGVYEGLWFFGSTPSSTLNGKTIKSMRLKVTRLSAGGNSGAVTCYFRPHAYTSKPSGDPTFLNAVTTASFKWKESKWVTIPSSFYPYFQNGSAKGIGIYIESTSSSYYAKFSTSAQLEVTYA